MQYTSVNKLYTETVDGIKDDLGTEQKRTTIACSALISLAFCVCAKVLLVILIERSHIVF